MAKKHSVARASVNSVQYAMAKSQDAVSMTVSRVAKNHSVAGASVNSGQYAMARSQYARPFSQSPHCLAAWPYKRLHAQHCIRAPIE